MPCAVGGCCSEATYTCTVCVLFRGRSLQVSVHRLLAAHHLSRGIHRSDRHRDGVLVDGRLGRGLNGSPRREVREFRRSPRCRALRRPKIRSLGDLVQLVEAEKGAHIMAGGVRKLRLLLLGCWANARCRRLLLLLVIGCRPRLRRVNLLGYRLWARLRRASLRGYRLWSRLCLRHGTRGVPGLHLPCGHRCVGVRRWALPPRRRWRWPRWSGPQRSHLP